MGGMIVQRRGGIFICYATAEFPVGAANRTGVPNSDFHSTAIQSVGSGLDQVRASGYSRIFIVCRAVERLVASEIVEH